MPTIDIREVDISTVSTADVTTNAVYVPGYAIQGPVNEPVLCNTIDEFREVFGSAPYKFENSDGVSTGYVYSWDEGLAEPSYVYAADLLRLGLPVLFERVDSGAEYATYSAGSRTDDHVDFSGRYPGKSYTKVKFSMSKKTVTFGAETIYVGEITVQRDADQEAGISAVNPLTTKFTFSQPYHEANMDYELWEIGSDVKNVDRTGLVTVTFENGFDTKNIPEITNKKLAYADPSAVDFTPADLYSFIGNDRLDKIKDKNEYVLKFITAGGYPTFFPNLEATHTYADKILGIATSRRDCTALIDYNVEIDGSITSDTTPKTVILDKVTSWVSALPAVGSPAEDAGNYGAMFTPWGTFESPTLAARQIKLAPSFAYLSALATSTQTYANWYAVAGVARGYIPNLVGVGYKISDSVGNALMPTNDVSINTIQLIRPYGYRIWGSRTLRNNRKYGSGDDTLMATSFLNIRQLANDIKRTVYVASKDCMFEPDDDVLWINYKSKITPMLDQMKGNRGLTTYTLKRAKTDKKATLKAVITVYAIDPVEHFDITLELSDDQITVTE